MPGLAQEVAVYAEYNLEKNIDEQIVRVLQRMKIAAETAA
jgi:hypothetical protein